MTKTGYCPNCKKSVLLKREDINWALAIFLLIFTSGIGLIIYLIIYLNQEEIYCIHCNSICTINKLENNSHQMIPIYSYESQERSSLEYEYQGDNTKYCPFCGVNIGDRSEVIYCALCGARVK